VALFVERVTSLQPAFELDAANAAHVVDVCRHLDGLPLAIELAAARVPLLGVAGVRQRLGERLRLLTGGARTVLRRHQTLRELLDWSHGLLAEGDRVVVRRLGVFAGSFAMAAAQRAVADEQHDEWVVLDRLGTLVNKSLLLVEPGDPPRYRLLESARAYALEKLRDAGEMADMLRRHAEAMRARFEDEWARHWSVPPQERAHRSLPDVENLRAALDWSQEAGQHELLVALAGASAWIWELQGMRVEGLRRCDVALGCVDDGTPLALEARLFFGRAELAHPRYDAAARAALDRALRLYRALDDRASAFRTLARLAICQTLDRDFGAADRAIEARAELHDPSWPPALRWHLAQARGWRLAYCERWDELPQVLDEAEQLARAANDREGLLQSLIYREQVAQGRGRTEEAVGRGRELLQMVRQDRFSSQRRFIVGNLAQALIELNELDEALPLIREDVANSLRESTMLARLDTLALLALRRGRPADAARVLGCSDAQHAFRQGRREFGEQRIPGLVQAALDTALAPAEGAKLSVEAAAALALGDREELAGEDA